jgi:hypothetical protein
MIYLVGAILVFEVLRLVLQLIDVEKVHKLNAAIRQELKDREKENQAIHKAEIEELKELAKGSKFIEGVVAGLQNKEDK